ncbi:pfkB-like carbohydrate kinase family protein [Prunus dulcis]|uniref:PfkB-like carbohydrate kinase family protein n=1 Tax=Prunus dulcis TaxID=3755 RepID=A0A4Y1S0I8_PRUDU|nr:pfkB-like carbohydrate kinase family protein [Prunus dulcis]
MAPHRRRHSCNLCVDIVLNVPKLPPPDVHDRKAYMDRLSASPPDKQYWEAGGNCNMAIAAARLGLHCIAIGHVGNEVYGQFLVDVLHDEGIGMVGMCENTNVDSSSASYETLLCWVLVDSLQRHGFCSRADFSKDPAFSWMSKLSEQVKTAIKQSKILFCNGYGFDELPPGVIVSAVEYAVEVGTALFFTLDLVERAFLLAESLTGIENPISAGQELLKQGVHTKWVIVKMGPRGSILITRSSISCAPAFKVNVIDTVGCGDSFVAAIAYGFIHNMPAVNTLAIANAVGGATAIGCGAGRNVATLEKVIELMKASNLNEDDEFFDELLNENLDVQAIKSLSKLVIKGSENQPNCVSLQKVFREKKKKKEINRLMKYQRAIFMPTGPVEKGLDLQTRCLSNILFSCFEAYQHLECDPCKRAQTRHSGFAASNIKLHDAETAVVSY